MENFTLGRVISSVGGSFFGDGSLLVKRITDITTDSRTVTRGCLFAAIKGNRNDGHEFLGQAVNAGALCCLAEHPGSYEYPVITVPSTYEALKKLARDYRFDFDIPFVGVTGSVGKTGTKEMLAAVLSRRGKILWTKGNFNNELGVPLTLFRLDNSHKAAVIEMGISDFGEMRRLAEMVRPDMAVFTTIGDSHLESLKNREGVLAAKAEILEGMRPGATVFINGDDCLLREYDFKTKIISFGTGNNCDVKAVNIRANGTWATSFEIIHGSRRFEVCVNAYGRQHVYSALAAAAVGSAMGMDDTDISLGIAAYETPGRRGQPYFTGHLTIIDDCYNSNPSSARMALDSLSVLPGRRIAILGDMLELGARRRELHNELGRYAADSGADLTIAAGELAEGIYDGALAAGAKALYFESKRELIKSLPNLTSHGDYILVKASRGMRFEDVVEALK